jgi:predicted AlkP superfamily pyrophosphatase or phosphodiesterase
VTSRYYASEYPAWVDAFHRRRPADAYFGTRWEPIPVDEKLLQSMAVVDSGAGAEDTGIPKSVGRMSVLPDAAFYAALFDSPYIDRYLLELARLLVREERLGADDTADFLALSFSSVDAVGHAYGPNSRESLDAVLRLDRELASFFDFLEETVGAGNVAVVLSSDHGVAPLPEYRAAQGLPAGRLSSPDFECFQRSGTAFERAFGRADWTLAPLTFDEEVLAGRGLSRETAEAFLAKELSACPSVARVFSRSELERAEDSDGGVDPMLELHRNSYHPGRSPDLVLQLEKWVIDRRRGTTHGSAYEYDTHVPAIVLWPGAKPGRARERIATVDLPVTLAALLGLATPKALDGVDRSHLFR